MAQSLSLLADLPVSDDATTLQVCSFLPGNYEAGNAAFAEAVLAALLSPTEQYLPKLGREA